MFVTDDVEERSFIAVNSGQHRTTSTAISRRLEHTVYRDNPDYMLTVDVGSALIDATDCTYGSRFLNNMCSSNARFVTMSLRDSSYDIVMVESICRIPAGTEVLVAYG